MSISACTRLQSLTTRPPTPPLDVNEDIENAIHFLTTDIDLNDKLSQLISEKATTSETPPNSSPLRYTCDNVTKRVGFSTTPIIHQPEKLSINGSSPRSSPIRAKYLQPRKSILKLGAYSPLPTPEDGDQQCYFSSSPKDFSRMLALSLNQLESSTRFTRLDGYLTINGALSAYDDSANSAEVARHMSSFQGHILRDTVPRELEDSTESNIFVQAIKLAARFVADDAYIRSTTSDFQNAILERCMNILDKGNHQKQVMKVALGLIAHQMLPSTIMTSQRLDRIVTALQTIEVRCAGNAVVTTRIIMYRRFIDHFPGVMSHRLRDWMQHLLHGMLSDVQEVRNRAIEACIHAGRVYGINASATKTIHELLETETDDGVYFDHLTTRLAQFVIEEKTKAVVPRIWSTIVLFHRNHKYPIQHWKRFKTWILLMQGCLFSSDVDTRTQAHLAWRKLVYVIRPDKNMSKYLVGLLLKPINECFGRAGADRRAKDLRRLGLEGYYNLLHYALRPELNAEFLSWAWDNFVREKICSMAQASLKGCLVACRILQGLLTSNSGSWNPAAALDEGAIVPEDLPRLNVQWVWSNLDKLLPVVEPILSLLLKSDNPEHYTASEALWNALLQCVVDASAQKVLLSDDLKSTIVNLLNTFQQLKDTFKPEKTALSRLHSLQRMTLKSLGPSRFLERFIVMDVNTNATLVVKGQTGQYSPLVFMLLCMAETSSDEAMQSLFELFPTIRSGITDQLSLLCHIWQGLDEQVSKDVDARLLIWSAFTSTILAYFKQEETHFLHEHMEVCFSLGSSLVLDSLSMSGDGAYAALTMSKLIKILSTIVDRVFNKTVLMTDMVEPVSKSMVAAQSKFNVRVAVVFISTILNVLPLSLHTDLTTDGTPQRMVPNHFLNLVEEVSVTYYTSGTITDEVAGLLLRTLMDMTAHAKTSDMLQFRRCMVLWIEDLEHRLAQIASSEADSIAQCWKDLLTSVIIRWQSDGLDLGNTRLLFMMGFQSTTRLIVERTIEVWNDTPSFHNTEEYLQSMADVLRAVNTVAILKMPTSVTQTSQPTIRLPVMDMDLNGAPIQALRSTRKSLQSGELAVAIPNTKASSSNKRTKKLFKSPRLRHDDSQVDFVPILQPPSLQTQISQLLTENQREVRIRQHGNVQQYPELSSSPMPAIYSMQHPAPLHSDVVSSSPAELTTPVVTEDVDMEDASGTPTPTPGNKRQRRLAKKLAKLKRLSESPSTPRQQDTILTSIATSDSGEIATISEQRPKTIAEPNMPDAQLRTYIEMAASPSHDESTSIIEAREEAAAITDSQASTASRKRKRQASQVNDKRSRRRTEAGRSSTTDDKEMGDEIVVTTSQKYRLMQEEQELCSQALPDAASQLLLEHTPASQSTSSNVSSPTSQVRPHSIRRRHKIRLKSRESQDEDLPSSRHDHEPEDIDMTDRIPATTVAESLKSSTSVIEQTEVDETSVEDGELSVPPRKGPVSTSTIITRLKEALDGCRMLVFGQREEREIDDLLFELRQANHEAGRRGREAK